MKSSEIRNKFLKYFESKGHKILPGSSLAPADPTVLLTLAGMLQFKSIFLGQAEPQYKRAATVQKCVRTIDVERVGHTLRHQTFFEMLGNFSFGDYFKEDAIKFAWEFLTGVCQIPAEKLSVAVFNEDDEAYSIWEKQINLPKEKIFRLDAANNFWAVGPTGPCGPCSEIYYDLGPALGCAKPDCAPGCDCDRFLEVWNLVFIQYNRDADGKLIPLKSKGIDTGMGLERLAAVLQGVDSNFETDLFLPLISKIKKLASQPEPKLSSLRIVADHSRAIVHLIADGIIPGNAGREYVLRRLIRRAVRHGRLLGINQPFLTQLAGEVVADMKEAYPNLAEKEQSIKQIIASEEANFLTTLEQGLELVEQAIKQHSQDKIIPGEVIFKLHDTYGFPFDLTKEIAAEAGCQVAEAGFIAEMEKQKTRARAAGISGQKKQLLAALNLEHLKPTKFEGYKKTSLEARVAAIFPAEKLVVLDQTPFYGESGGQVGDTGVLKLKDKKIKVLDTLISPKGTFLHEVEDLNGLEEHDKISAVVDVARRQAIEKHHTATHLLHQALREVLGGQVKQAGSYVGPDKLRFDFSHHQALTAEQISQVEEIVNQKIKTKLKVEALEKSYQDAVKMGALALFGEKYGDKVRVLKIADYSLELCGGTHVQSTAEIQFIKIISEGALGAGVRRLEARAGEAARLYVADKCQSLCAEAAELLNKYQRLEKEKEQLGGQRFSETNIFQIEGAEIIAIEKAVENQDSIKVNKFLDHLQGRVDWLKERIAKSEKDIRQLKLKAASGDTAGLDQEIKTFGSLNVLLKEVPGYSMDMMRALADSVKNRAKSVIVLLAAPASGNVRFLITVTDDLVAAGQSARKIADIFAPIVGGKGGGRDGKVEGGGAEPSKVLEGFAAVIEFLHG